MPKTGDGLKILVRGSRRWNQDDFIQFIVSKSTIGNVQVPIMNGIKGAAKKANPFAVERGSALSIGNTPGALFVSAFQVRICPAP